MTVNKKKISEFEHIDSYRPVAEPTDDNIMVQIADMKVIGAFPNDNKNVQVPVEKLRGYTAFREWQLKRRVAGEPESFEDWLEFLREPAREAAERVNFLSDHRDKVIDGYWHSWDEQRNEYVTTGEIAKGNVMLPCFSINPTTGELTITTDDEYTGPEFSINQFGYLQFKIK